MPKIFPAAILLALTTALPAVAQLPCNPCVGLSTDDAAGAAAALDALPDLPEGAVLVVRWPVALADDAGVAAAREAASALVAAGARPWYAVRFAAPPPSAERGDELTAELERLADLARSAEAGALFQLEWPGERSNTDLAVQEYALALKRASVAVSGARPGAGVVTQALPPDPDLLRALHGQELDAYLDGVSFRRTGAADTGRMKDLMRELDPDALVVVEASTAGSAGALLAAAASDAEAGASLSLFRLSGDAATASGQLQAARLLAQEFSGDVTFDPYSTPSGADAWSFVRGEDLSLRVIVAPPPDGADLTLQFTDRQIGSPARFDPATGESELVFGGRRTRNGYELPFADAAMPFVFRLERDLQVDVGAGGSLAEALTVADTRRIPVGEILRRLQAFEDDQSRRIANYTATNTTSLRFQLGTGVQSVDATFRGPFFFRQGEGFDWAWSDFFVNGIRWRRKRIPEIPLIQPEKAAAMPAEITFNREYRYRLRGVDTVEGRDAWVVDFEPAAALAEGRSLFRARSGSTASCSRE